MATIAQIVAQIRTAIYGKDVRENIAQGIEKCYEDSTANAQIQEIINKGQETLDSIPEDYTALTGEVDDLKSAISGIGYGFEPLTCKADATWNNKDVYNLTIIDNLYRCLTDTLPMGVFHLKVSSNVRFAVVTCDSSGNPTAVSSYSDASNTDIEYNGQVDTGHGRILLMQKDGSPITKAQADSWCKIYLTDTYREQYDARLIDNQKILSEVIPTWKREAYNSSNVVVSSTTRCLTDIILAGYFKLSIAAGYKAVVVWLDDNDNVLVKDTDFRAAGDYYINGRSAKVRITAANTSNTDITIEQAMLAVRIQTVGGFASESIEYPVSAAEMASEKIQIAYESGAINNSGEETSQASNRVRSFNIVADYMRVAIASGYKYQVVTYNGNGKFINKSSSWVTTETEYSGKGKQYRFIVAKSGDTDINPKEAKDAVACYAYIDKKEYGLDHSEQDNQNLIGAEQQLPNLWIGSLQINNYANNCPFCAYTKNGTLIVGCDVRQGTGNDTEPIDIYIVRSTDNGQTFGNPIKVLEKGTRAEKSRVTDGCIVVSNTGRIFIFAHWCNTNTVWQSIGTSGTDEREYFDMVYKYSDDDGVTWSEMKSLQDLYYSNTDIITMFDGLAAGMVMENGMIIIPAQCKMKSYNTSTVGPMFSMQSCFIYSSDDGETWEMSDLVPVYSSENNIVEYEKNKLMMNCRGFISGRRVFTCEYDESTGEFSDWELNPADCVLIEPGASQASFMKFQIGFRAVGLFMNSMSLTSRGKTTLQATRDYLHYYPIVQLRNMTDATYGHSCMAAYKMNLVASVAHNNGQIRLYNLTDYIPLVFSI